MATITDETQKQSAAEFEAAYAEDVKKPTQSDDEAFGLVPDEAPGTATPTGTPAVAVDLDKGADAGAEAGAQGGAAAAAGGTAGAGEEGGAAAAPALDVEKETQRLKSWEGRLKAQQAEIDRTKAEAAAAAERGDIAGTGVQDDKGGKDDQGGEDDAYKAAMEALEADFGPEFVQLLTTVVSGLAARTASEHAAPYRKDIDGIIAEITNDRQRAHFEKIADAHPDFLEVAESDAFKGWVAGLEADDKAETERIASSGTAKEIIAMLKRYKATVGTKDAGDPALDAAMDQAEGVRSTGGLKLPENPQASNDFASAWEKF